MKSEPSHSSTDGSNFNFADFTAHDDSIHSFGDTQNAAGVINTPDPYLLGFDNDYLVAPFESGSDIFAFRGVGSPSPPESQEQSPKSTNTSPNSSESSPPQLPGSKAPDGLTMVTDCEDDFPMLDETSGSITFPLSSSSNGFFGSNFTPLVPAPSHISQSLSGPERMAVDDTAKFFDFESAASSPLAVKIEGPNNQPQHSIPRFFTNTKMQTNGTHDALHNAHVSFGSDTLPQMSTPSYSGNRKKRRSESSALSPNSAEALAAFTFETNGHPSPASSATNGVTRNRNGKRHGSASTSGEEEAVLLKSTGFHPSKPFSMSSMWSPTSFSSASPMANIMAYSPNANGESSYRLTLRGDQPGGKINEKSRVETQIRVNLNLSPLPTGVSKLHLPTHTISKPKLLSKPPHQKSTDTLELYTSLICASAVEGNPDLLQKVLQRAADDPLQERVFGSLTKMEDGNETYNGEDDKPLNGGEVRICAGCITRERKRAARKKIKKVEEEESWAKDENKRIIVFNCSEILEWGPPEAQKKAEMEAHDGDITSPGIESNAEIWLPMRIACYCRHQSEKSGFRIILTIKDHNDNLVAQNITPPILITDDHKTNAPSQQTAQQAVAAAPANSSTSSVSSPVATQTSANGPVPVAPAPLNSSLTYSASDTNLLTLGQSQTNPFDRGSSSSNRSSSARQHSRHSSVNGIQSPPPYPAASGGPAKKRKANPSAKTRNELTMTKIDTSSSTASSNQAQAAFGQQPFTPSAPNFSMTGMLDQSQSQFTPTTPLDGTSSSQNYFGFHNRNHSIDSLHGMQVFSAPPSAPGSRVPSRVASPVQQFAIPQAQRPVFTQSQFAQVQSQLLNVANGQLSQTLMPFDITRIVPTEGPCQGGIEVTILGSGFQRSHTVYFGDKQSPRTEYWSDTTIVCLLPPSSTPGTVPVVLRYAAQPALNLPGRAGRFMYNDDTEQKMLALALQVINAKWSGKIEPPKDIAMRLLMDEKSPGNGSTSTGGGSGHRSHSAGNNFNLQALQLLQSPVPSIDLEAQLLKLLDIIDMDDSPYPAKLNLRNRQGQSMLHLSCSLGYNRFTAALLARGANPDVADKGGFTPTHFAALMGHRDIVRRLRLNRADLNIESLSGVIPEELAESDEVVAELTAGRNRSRRPSVSSVASAPGRVMNGRRSRSGSIASAMAAWEPFTAREDYEDATTDDEDDEAEDEELWIRPKRTISSRNLRDLASGRLTMVPRAVDAPLSRKASRTNLAAFADVASSVIPPELEVDEANAAPAATVAALVALREQVANLTMNLPNFHNMNWNLPNLPNLQNFQQQMHLNLQNLQGQTARFNALLQGQRVGDNAVPTGEPTPVPTPTPNPRVGSIGGSSSPTSDYKWWELFSNPTAPPAYEELYPDGTARGNPGDDKMQILGEAVARAMEVRKATTTTSSIALQAPVTKRNVVTASAESSRIVVKSKATNLTKEEEEAMRAHHEKMKRIRSDRRLLFFWLPICVLILFGLLTSWGTNTWAVIQTTYEVVKERMAEAAEATAEAGRRIVEV